MVEVALLSGKLPPLDKDGIGDYTAHLGSALPQDKVKVVLAKPERNLLKHLKKELQGVKIVHVQHPSFGANPKQALVPFLVKIANPGAIVITTMHEWDNMHPLMRNVMIPLVAMSKHIVFASKTEMKRYRDSRVGRSLRKETTYIPIGSNLEKPILDSETILKFRNERVLENGKWDKVIAHFGFINASKQPEKLLDALKLIVQKSPRTKLLFVGDFFPHRMDRKAEFVALIQSMDLQDNVEITGFIEDQQLAANLLAASDAVIALFNDGVRFCSGSFWYSAQLGNPIITTLPKDPEEFAGVEHAIAEPHVRLVGVESTPDDIATQIDSLPEFEPIRFQGIDPPSWGDIAHQHTDLYESFGVKF